MHRKLKRTHTKHHIQSIVHFISLHFISCDYDDATENNKNAAASEPKCLFQIYRLPIKVVIACRCRKYTKNTKKKKMFVNVLSSTFLNPILYLIAEIISRFVCFPLFH